MAKAGFDTPELKEKSKKEKAPVLFIELCDQRDSGWVLDGTSGTVHETRLTSPSAEFIPNRGYRKAEGKNPETGEVEAYDEEIRYIKNQRILSVQEQKLKGITPSKNKLEDKIIIKGGNFSVVREGAYIGLYDYLKDVYYNTSNPDRSPAAKDIFKVVEVGKKEEAINDATLRYADAVQLIGTLYAKKKDGYKYNEPKIDALCSVFQVFAETYSGKVNGLLSHAQRDPEGFLQRALKFEQTIVMEVGHAFELDVLKFEGNTAMLHDGRVLADLGAGNMKHETKLNKLADLLATDEYKSKYDELKIELEVAQEKALQ